MTDLVAVDEQDIENLKAIQASGVEVEFRMLPRDKRKVLEEFDL